MNIVVCDGGLANRLNALIFALVLQRRFGHPWRISWPVNNWCGAPLEALFVPPLPHDRLPLTHYRDASTLPCLMHENQIGFDAERYVPHREQLKSFDDWAPWLDRGVVYFNNLIPEWVGADEVHAAVATMRPAAEVERRAREFCLQHRIDRGVVGLHIRKTDFGDAVNDQALFEQARASPQRFFVCSDAADVNRRFAQLPNCAVFEKTAFPEKRVQDAAWLHWNTDAEGRRFPFNIERGAAAVVEGLIDLLILSRTQPVPTSRSTFLTMAALMQRSGLFQFPLPPIAMEKPVTHTDLFALLNLIRPWQMASDVKLRIGAEGDGGYVLPRCAERSNLVLSIGIGNEASFDDELAERGARVLQFDHTIERSPSRHGRIGFHRKGWGSRDEGPLISLASMIRMFDWQGARHPILKFDTEGAEWDCLFDAATEDLQRFEILTGEFHDFQNLVNRDYYDRAFAVFSKLAATHHVVHLHANNAGGLVMIGGVPFPRLLELTYLRKDVALFSGHSAEPIPGPLDRPNVAQLPEIYLRAF
jgi:hypothetical protein